MSTTEGIAYFKPARTIGGFSAYIVVEETTTDESEISDHPVEIGATVSDHVVLKPSSVTIRALTGIKFGPLEETLEKLRALWRAREPMDVVTGRVAYRNMILKRIQTQLDPITANVNAWTAELREVILVSVTTTSIPPAARHKNAAKTQGTTETGQKQATRYRRGDEKITGNEELLPGPPDPVDSWMNQGADALGGLL